MGNVTLLPRRVKEITLIFSLVRGWRLLPQGRSARTGFMQVKTGIYTQNANFQFWDK